MRVRLKKSPRIDKKFRVTFENGKIVDFGARGYSDYTIHKNPLRMRSYVTRHGGFVPHMVQKQTDPKLVHKICLMCLEVIKKTGQKQVFLPRGFGPDGFYGVIQILKVRKRLYLRSLIYLFSKTATFKVCF